MNTGYNILCGKFLKHAQVLSLKYKKIFYINKNVHNV